MTPLERQLFEALELCADQLRYYEPIAPKIRDAYIAGKDAMNEPIDAWRMNNWRCNNALITGKDA